LTTVKRKATTKVIGILLLLILVGGVFLGGYKTVRTIKENLELKQKITFLENNKRAFKKIKKNAVVSENRALKEKEFKKQISNLTAKNQELKLLLDTAKKQGRIKYITKTEVKFVDRVVYKDLKSTTVIGGKYTKILKYKNGMYVGYVKFDTTKLKKPWSYALEQFKIKINIVQAKAKKGPDIIAIQANIVDSKGKKYKPKIELSKTIQRYEKNGKIKLSLSPFTLEGGLVGGVSGSLKPIFGYVVGFPILKLKDPTNKDIARFLTPTIGLTFDGKGIAGLGLASYNLSNNIPILNDTFISFGAGLTFPTVDYFLYLGLTTTF